MNRNEIRGLSILVMLIALGIGAKAWENRQRGGVWVKTASVGSTAGVPENPPIGQASRLSSSSASRPLSLPASAPSPSPNRLDLNRATEAELDALPLIGSARVRQILAYRTEKGRFIRVEELRETLHLGETSWRRIEPLVCVASPSTSTTVLSTPSIASQSPTISPSPAPSITPALSANLDKTVPSAPLPTPSVIASPFASLKNNSSAASPLTPHININTASAQELEALWRIGPKLSQRIVQYRTQKGPFKTIEDLMLVPGIGPAIFAHNRDLITVSSPQSPK